MTSRGISINGCAGSGKTTIGRELAARLAYPLLDLDDYYWNWDTKLPYQGLRSKDEVIRLLERGMAKHPRFVMAGSIGSKLWDFVNPLLDLAVLLHTPKSICLERAKNRAFEKWGNAVLVGGDLHENHLKFYETIEQYFTGENPSYSLQRHEKWAQELNCPVLQLDGTRDIDKNVDEIIKHYRR